MAHSHACTDPQHHVHDGDAFVREVERACEQRGLRLTPIRANALRLIADAGRPIKAYDLLDQMKATHDAAAPPTVYRALDFLLEHGFIHKLASINAFVGCHHPGQRRTCGAVPDLRRLPVGDRTRGRGDRRFARRQRARRGLHAAGADTGSAWACARTAPRRPHPQVEADAGSHVNDEAPATSKLWRDAPGQRWLGRLAALPGLKRAARPAYDGFARGGNCWSRRKGHW
jgi:hypothetical protein